MVFKYDNFFEAAINALSDGLLISDNNHNIIFVNSIFKKFFNIESKDISTMKCYNIIHCINHPHEECPKFDNSNNSYRRIIEKQDNKIFEIEINSIINENGEFNGAIHLIRDITEKENTEKALIEARVNAELIKKSKIDFLINIGRELRTPLNAILGFTNLLIDDDRVISEHKENLHQIKYSAQNLFTIIQDLLDFTRLGSGKIKLQTTSFNLKELIDSIAFSMTRKAMAKGLELIINFDDNCKDYIGDKHRIAQILINLLSNAIKYTNTGSITVTVKRTKHLEISIADTGIGIPPEMVNSLFDPFREDADPYLKTTSGIGLGLSIVKQLLNLIGGSISVNSIPARGSVFTVKLPFTNNSEAETDTEISNLNDTEIVPNEEKLKILIVEDDLTNLLLVKILLKKNYFDVFEARNGLEAVIKAKAIKFDCILMDIGLPELNGFEATKQIRNFELEKGWHTPIIALTAHAYSDDKKKSIESGMDAYIPKPLDRDKLLQTIFLLTKR
jgi:PAS domain S-box-containing protein